MSINNQGINQSRIAAIQEQLDRNRARIDLRSGNSSVSQGNVLDLGVQNQIINLGAPNNRFVSRNNPRSNPTVGPESNPAPSNEEGARSNIRTSFGGGTINNDTNASFDTNNDGVVSDTEALSYLVKLREGNRSNGIADLVHPQLVTDQQYSPRQNLEALAALEEFWEGARLGGAEASSINYDQTIPGLLKVIADIYGDSVIPGSTNPNEQFEGITAELVTRLTENGFDITDEMRSISYFDIAFIQKQIEDITGLTSNLSLNKALHEQMQDLIEQKIALFNSGDEATLNQSGRELFEEIAQIYGDSFTDDSPLPGSSEYRYYTGFTGANQKGLAGFNMEGSTNMNIEILHSLRDTYTRMLNPVEVSEELLPQMNNYNQSFRLVANRLEELLLGGTHLEYFSANDQTLAGFLAELASVWGNDGVVGDPNGFGGFTGELQQKLINAGYDSEVFDTTTLLNEEQLQIILDEIKSKTGNYDFDIGGNYNYNYGLVNDYKQVQELMNNWFANENLFADEKNNIPQLLMAIGDIFGDPGSPAIEQMGGLTGSIQKALIKDGYAMDYNEPVTVGILNKINESIENVMQMYLDQGLVEEIVRVEFNPVLPHPSDSSSPFTAIVNLPRDSGQDLMNYVSRLQEIAPEIEDVDIFSVGTWLHYLGQSLDRMSEAEISVFESGLLDVNQDGIIDLVDYYAVMAANTQGNPHNDKFNLGTYNEIHSVASLGEIKDSLLSLPRTNSSEVVLYLEAIKSNYIDPTYGGPSHYRTLDANDVSALRRYVEDGQVGNNPTLGRAKFAFDNGLYDFNNDGVTDASDVEILSRYVSGNVNFDDLVVTSPGVRTEPAPPSSSDRARLAIDTNSDNWVSVEEMVQARLEMRLAQSQPNSFPNLVAKYDFNQDGRVDDADVNIAMRLLNSGQVNRVNEELERIRNREASVDRVIAALDEDNNLIVTVEETVKAMLEMRLANIYPESYPELVQKYDFDRNGVIDIRDHEVIAVALGRGVIEGANAELARLDRAVNALDTNQDYDLSVEEMVQAMLEMKRAHSDPRNFPELVAKYDFNQDGKVDQKDRDLVSYYLSPDDLAEVESRLAAISSRHADSARAAAVIDLNSDNWVSVEEMIQAILDIQLAQTLPGMFPQLVTKYDFNQDGVVDQEDRDIAMGILNSGQTNQFNQEFNRIISDSAALEKARVASDRDSNYLITARELYDTMMEMKFAQNLPNIFPHLVEKYDFDGDGKVDQKDYYLALRLANNGMINEINQRF